MQTLGIASRGTYYKHWFKFYSRLLPFNSWLKDASSIGMNHKLWIGTSYNKNKRKSASLRIWYGFLLFMLSGAHLNHDSKDNTGVPVVRPKW